MSEANHSDMSIASGALLPAWQRPAALPQNTADLRPAPYKGKGKGDNAVQKRIADLEEALAALKIENQQIRHTANHVTTELVAAHVQLRQASGELEAQQNSAVEKLAKRQDDILAAAAQLEHKQEAATAQLALQQQQLVENVGAHIQENRVAEAHVANAMAMNQESVKAELGNAFTSQAACVQQQLGTHRTVLGEYAQNFEAEMRAQLLSIQKANVEQMQSMRDEIMAAMATTKQPVMQARLDGHEHHVAMLGDPNVYLHGNASDARNFPAGLQPDNYSDMMPDVITAPALPGGIPIGDVPKLGDSYTEWRQQLGIWVQTNSHLTEGQRVGLVLMSLRGSAKAVGLNLHKEQPNVTLATLLTKLRAHFIPDEMAHTIGLTSEFYQLAKGDSETLARFLDRFERTVNSVRRRGIALDDRQVYARCIQAIKPTPDFKASIMTQCPNDTYEELRAFLRKYANFQTEAAGDKGKGSSKAYQAQSNAPAQKGQQTAQPQHGKGGGKGKSNHATGVTCYKCGNNGHIARDCKVNSNKEGSRDNKAESKTGPTKTYRAKPDEPIMCWKCGKTHKKSDKCTGKAFMTTNSTKMEGEKKVYRAVQNEVFTPTATVDTAFNGTLLCSKKWLNAYVAVLRKKGYRDPIEYDEPDDTNFTFGDGQKKSPLTAVWLPMFLKDKMIHRKAQVIAGSLPLLLGLEMLQEGNAEIKLGRKVLLLDGEKMAIHINKDNHIAIDIAPTDAYVKQSQALAHLHRAGSPWRGTKSDAAVYFTAAKYVGSESEDLAAPRMPVEGKIAELQHLRQYVQKALPEVRVPPKVMIVDEEDGRVCPPTMAYEAPNHVLVVGVSKNGALNAHVNASSSNKFGYKVGKGSAHDDSQVEKCVAIFYHESGDKDIEPVVTSTAKSRSLVLAATVNSRTTKYHVTAEEQKQAVADITSEVSKLDIPQSRCVVLGKRHQGGKWTNSAETYVTPKLNEAMNALCRAVYDGKDLFHAQIILPGHTNTPIRGTALKEVTWDAEKFQQHPTLQIRSIKPSKTKQYVNSEPSQVMVLLAQPPLGSPESNSAERKLRERQFEEAKDAEGFEPKMRMPLPKQDSTRETAVELKKLIVGNDPKVKELIEKYVFSENNIAESLTDETQYSGYNLDDEAQLEKLAKHVYKNLGSPSWVRAQQFLKNMQIPRMLYDGVRKIAREEEQKQPLSKQPLHNISSLPLSAHFNDVISLDAFSVGEYEVAHIIDVKERFSVLKLMPRNTAKELKAAFLTGWVAMFGVPNFLLMDSSTAALSPEFGEFVEDLGTTILAVPVQAHNSVGIVERHHQSVKHQLQNLAAKLKGEGLTADIRELLSYAQVHHNWMPTGTDGFSPSQRLMGRNFTIPGIDLEKSALPTLLQIAEDHDPANRTMKAHGLMAILRAEHETVSNSRKLAKAISHKVRTDKRQKLHFGDWVYVYREDKNHIRGRWVGPAKVVGGHSRLVLVELAGKIYRTSAQFLCHVSAVKEQIGAPEGDTAGQPQDGDVGFPLGDNLALSPDVTLPPALADGEGLPEEHLGWADAESTAQPAASEPNDQPSMDNDDVANVSDGDDTKAERIALITNAEAEPEASDDDEAKPQASVTQPFGAVSEWAKYTTKGSTVPNRFCNDGAWLEAKSKELNALYKYGSVENVKMGDVPQGVRVLDTLWVNTLKLDPIAGNAEPTEYHLDEYFRAKSRLTVRGDQENVSNVPVASPTADKAVLRMALALVPVMGWRIASLDITNAFLQGKDLGDGRQVYIRPPVEVIKGCSDIVWRAKKCVYGLADAPLSWHKSLTEQLLNLGGKVSKYDPNVIVFTGMAGPTDDKCKSKRHQMGEVGTAYNSDDANQDELSHDISQSDATKGMVVLFVDDILLQGQAGFLEQKIKEICEAFDVGKVERDEFKHLGVLVKHDLKENCIELTMPDYAEKLKKIPVNPLRASVKDDKLTPREVSQFRSALGQMAWLATNLRPDLAAECSMLLSTNLEAEHQCLDAGMVPEEAHKTLQPQAEQEAQPQNEALTWLAKQIADKETSACENLVYKVKRKTLEDPAGANLTVYNLQALNKAIGKAKSHESKVTYRDVTMGKGPSDISLVVHSDSSLLNATKFTSQQGTSLIMTSKSYESAMAEPVQAQPLTKRARKPLSIAAFEPGNMVHWSSRRSKRVHISSFSAETAGLLESVDYVIYAKNLANEMAYGCERGPIGATAYSDQLAVVSNCVNLSVTSAEKRLNAAFYYIRQCVSEGELKAVKFVPSDLNISDALTKGMQSQPLMYLMQQNVLVLPDTEQMSGKKRAKRNNVVLSEATKK